MDGGDACKVCHCGLRLSSCGATQRVSGVPKWVAGTHANCASGTFSRAPTGPRNVEGACQNLWRGRMRVFPTGPSAELLWGHETCQRRADM
eukprot:1270994-Pyramimonas_sp.AAC.1